VLTDLPRISIVIPAYNAGAFIAQSLQRLKLFLDAAGLSPFEIIVVDDGSIDNTACIVADAYPDFRIIRHEENRGKGAAVRTGMMAASGQFRFFIDADIPYALDAIHTMLDYLENKKFDLVVGTRSIGNTPRSDSRPGISRRIASWVFTEFVGRIVVTGVRDTQCGFKAFRGEAASVLFSDTTVENFAFDVEVLYYAFKRDMDIKRIPVQLIVSDDSSVSLLRHAAPMLYAVMCIPFRYHLGGGKQAIADSTHRTEPS